MWRLCGVPKTRNAHPRKTPLRRGRTRVTPQQLERAALRARVGKFLRARRAQLGLSQGDIMKIFSYGSRNSISNLETGREGLPAKRVYAWADLLQVPRDLFFRFVTGEIETMDAGAGRAAGPAEALSSAELELVTAYRQLPVRYQDQLRDTAHAFEAMVRAEARTERRHPRR
jgi:transcriptional regulator with XRE-family HTH domain